MKKPARAAAETVEIVHKGLAQTLREIPPETSDRLIRQVGQLLEEQIEKERERCATECRRRSDLWRHTTQSGIEASPGREEARARANEALYLADLLASGRETEEGPPADA
jgi:hypothetical protein